jgi:hypothetical protein
MSGDTLTILVPLYNDWESIKAFLRKLNLVASEISVPHLRVVLVDDGSLTGHEASLDALEHDRIESIEVIRLVRNMGHQRAIAVGLVHLYQENTGGPVVIIDGDGEDAPEDIVKLLQAGEQNSGGKIVFAERTIRSEGCLFSAFYQLYRTMHYVFTGRRIRFGNFSVVPRELLKPMVTVPELWNHYAASVVAAKLPIVLVPTARAKRYQGRSKMSFIMLVTHGLSAIAVHREVVCTRVLLMLGALASVLIFALTAAAFSSPFQLAWLDATVIAGIIITLLTQILSIVLFLVFLILGNRDRYTFIPLRDCGVFIEGKYTVK